MSDGLPTVAEARIWDKSGLIEEARVPDQSLFQTEEFDRENPGNLENYELVRRKDIVRLLIQKYLYYVELESEQDTYLKASMCDELLEEIRGQPVRQRELEKAGVEKKTGDADE